PDIATRFLGVSVSSHQLLDLARTIEATGLAHAREATNWSETGKAVEQGARALRLASAPIEALPGRKATFETLPNAQEFDEALEGLLAAMDKACALLHAVSEKHPDL